MKLKVKKLISKMKATDKRPYPVVQYVAVDENGEEKILKSFFEIKEGDEVDVTIKEQERDGVKELIGYKVKEKKSSRGGRFYPSFVNSEEGVKLKIKEGIFEKILEITQEKEKIKDLFALGVELIFGSKEVKEEKENKSKGKITEEQLKVINDYLGNDVEKLRRLLDWMEEHWGVSNFQELSYEQAEKIISKIEKK